MTESTRRVKNVPASPDSLTQTMRSGVTATGGSSPTELALAMRQRACGERRFPLPIWPAEVLTGAMAAWRELTRRSGSERKVTATELSEQFFLLI